MLAGLNRRVFFMGQSIISKKCETPCAFALRKAREIGGAAVAPLPRDLLSAVNLTVLPAEVSKGLQHIVSEQQRNGTDAALTAVERIGKETGPAYEYNLAFMSLLREAGKDTLAATARFEASVSRAFLGAKDAINRGHSELARDLLLRIIPIVPFALAVKANDARRSLAAAVSLLGLALQDLALEEDAIESYQLSLSLLDPNKSEDLAERATILMNLGALFQEVGRYDDSSEVLDEAVSISRSLLPESAISLFVALTNRSQSEDYRGRRTSAARDWAEANETLLKYGLEAEAKIVDGLMVQASHLFDAGRWYDGIRVLRDAWRGACRGDHAALKAELISVAAQSALRAELTPHAIKWFGEAVGRFDALAPDYAVGRIDAKRSMARALNLAEQPHEALPMAEQALNEGIRTLGQSHPQNAQTHRQLANILWNLDRFAEGEEHVRTARKILLDNFTGDHPSLMACDGELAEHLLQRGADREAIDLMCDCLEREGRALRRLIDSRSDLIDVTSIRMTSGQLELLLLAAARAQNLDDARLRRIMNLRLQFGGSALAILKTREQVGPSEGTLLEKLLQPYVSVASTGVYQFDGVEKRVLLVARTDTIVLLDLGPSRDIDDDVAAWVADPDSEPGPALKVLTSHLARICGQQQRLVWLPDRALLTCPIAPLPIDQERRILDLVCVLQPRDAHSLLAPTSANSNPPLIVGISSFTHVEEADDLDPLPGVSEEIERVRRIYGPTCAVLSDNEASLEAVLCGLLNEPSILHIATHGLCAVGSAGEGSRGASLRRRLAGGTNEDPLSRCALLLAGVDAQAQLLTARRLAELELSGIYIAVLSACDTGVGAIDAAEGVLGFKAALHHAGVANVVTSLWPLDDHVAPQLMEDFHRGLYGGLRPSEALRNAQLKWSRLYSPQLWGGLTISGSDLPLRLEGRT